MCYSTVIVQLVKRKNQFPPNPYNRKAMSHQDANAFLDRMKSDDTFNEAVNRMEDVETKMAFINRQGYQFTSDELEDAFHTHF